MSKVPEPESVAMQGPESSGPPEPGSFADGYHQGQDDVLFGLAHGHRWALDKLDGMKARLAKIAELNAAISKERRCAE